MRGSEVFVYNWQIKKETKKSFLVFLALGRKHKSKKIKVWLPKKTVSRSNRLSRGVYPG